MEHKIPQLPYNKNALAPYVSSETLEYHYEKHHRAYVAKLNALIQGTDFEAMNLIDIILSSSGPIFNNAAQHWNHTFFWGCLRPPNGAGPSQKFVELLRGNFGGLEEFKTQFGEAALANFGSGWTWLVQNENGSLEILNTSNADNPLRHEQHPLLTLDVWEHAYYIDYRNSRPNFVNAFWQLANWEFVEANLSRKQPKWARMPGQTEQRSSTRLPH